MRNRGDDRHNNLVIEENCGELILSRVPSPGTQLKDLKTCQYCFLWVRDLRKHLTTKGRCKAEKEIELACSGPQLKFFEKEVIDKLRNDEIGSVIRKDELLIMYGNDSISKVYSNKLKGGSYTSNKLRLCARLLLELRKKKK